MTEARILDVTPKPPSPAARFERLKRALDGFRAEMSWLGGVRRRLFGRIARRHDEEETDKVRRLLID
jgi:hypothetical protein